MTGKPKLVILQTHPIQYYAPLYKALSELGELAVKVIYLTDAGARGYYDPGFGQEVEWDVPLLDGYEHVILQPGTGIGGRTFWSRHDAQLVGLLDREQPDWLLLYGYASRMNWVALLWAARRGVKLAYTSDTNNRIMRSGFRTMIKWPALRSYFALISAFFSPSVANRSYLTRFGADPTRIHWCPFAIDAERFACSSVHEREFDFLWAGKLIPLKRPHDFLDALEMLETRGHIGLKAGIIGNGPMLSEIHQRVSDGYLRNVAECIGFLNQSAMAKTLCNSRMFVFTSERDQYGLAVTEAASCGNAVVVADVNGCVGPDSSAQPGENALTYPVGDVLALADAMETLLVDEPLRSRMQAASKRIGVQHDVSNAARIISKVLMDE